MATDKYTINYDDQKFKDIKAAESSELSALDKQYGLQADGKYKGGLIGDAEEQINAQIQAAEKYKEEQTKLQNEQTNFVIEQINQDKEKTEKDYQREQRASHADYTKATDRYGVEAEQMATSGLLHSGYSESYKSRAYVAHQNRVATAKSTLDLAVQNYNNKITEARLQNSATLAEIAYDTLVKQSELAVQLITTKSGLLAELTSQKNTIKTLYQNKWNDVLDQMNKENSLKQQADQMAQQQAQWDKEYALKQKDQELNERQVKIAEEKWKLEKAELESNAIANNTPSKTNYGNSTKVASARSRRQANPKTADSTTVVPKSEPTVDKTSLNNVMKKLNKAGIMCKNAAQLNEYIKVGLVREYVENGKLKYSTTGNPMKSKSSLKTSKTLAKHFGITPTYK